MSIERLVRVCAGAVLPALVLSLVIAGCGEGRKTARGKNLLKNASFERGRERRPRRLGDPPLQRAGDRYPGGMGRRRQDRARREEIVLLPGGQGGSPLLRSHAERRDQRRRSSSRPRRGQNPRRAKGRSAVPAVQFRAHLLRQGWKPLRVPTVLRFQDAGAERVRPANGSWRTESSGSPTTRRASSSTAPWEWKARCGTTTCPSRSRPMSPGLRRKARTSRSTGSRRSPIRKDRWSSSRRSSTTTAPVLEFPRPNGRGSISYLYPDSADAVRDGRREDGQEIVLGRKGSALDLSGR